MIRCNIAFPDWESILGKIVIARERSDRGNPRNKGRGGLYRRSYTNLRDCFVSLAMT